MNQQIPSILMCVGKKFYTLAEIINEAKYHGVSKRIPMTSVPQGLQKGVSKVFLAHPDAIIIPREGSLAELAFDLMEKGMISPEQLAEMIELDEPWMPETLNAEDFVPAPVLTLAYALSSLPANDRSELEDKYKIEYRLGIFGFAPYTGIEYVLKDGETELPQQLAHMEGYVEPVIVFYDDEGEADD